MREVLIGSVLSALSTGLGAAPILLMRSISHLWRDMMLAFTAGVMVAASMFNLIPVAMEQSGLAAVAAGIALGAGVLAVMEKRLPHIDLHHGHAGDDPLEQAVADLPAQRRPRRARGGGRVRRGV